MRITIINGNADVENQAFESYLDDITSGLSQRGHEVEHIRLRDFDLRYCIGCFGCWVKTPGECVTPDDSSEIRKKFIQSDFLLWASPLVFGYPSAKLKLTMDKSIPLVHPYFEVVHGEAHHQRRYSDYPRLGLLIQKEDDTDSQDLVIVENLFRRTALNLKSNLCFMGDTSQPQENLIKAIEESSTTPEVLPLDLPATKGSGKIIPKRLVVINGSPRGKKSNTRTLFEQFIKGFTASQPGATVEIFDLVRLSAHAEIAAAASEADAVLIGFPLYTDAMPGVVKAFIETMGKAYRGKKAPALGFLVQSGFPESMHSRFIEQYLQKLAARLGSPYLGTIVKGGCEGIMEQPEAMTNKLFTQFEQIGKTFGQTGELDASLLAKLAKPERYAGYMIPIFNLLSKIGLLNMWWDKQLKENNAYQNRFDKPYV